MRASSQSTRSAACALVLDAANLQPALPVQATSPVRSGPGLAQAQRRDRGQRLGHAVVRDVGDQQVLPHGQADRAGAEAVGDVGQPAHPLAGDAADRQHHADIGQARLLLRMHADMAVRRLRRRGRERLGGTRVSGRPSSASIASRNSVEAPAVQHVFQPRLVAVGAVAVGDEHAQDGVADRRGVGGRDDHAGLAGEVLVAGDAAQRQAVVDARLARRCPSATGTAVKAMSLVSSSTGIGRRRRRRC